MYKTLDKQAEKLSAAATRCISSSWAFTTALLTIIAWGITGPIFNYSDTWQLVINTGTTIITFLLGFLIARTQDKSTKAIHIKLDELLASQPHASNKLINIEELDEQQITTLHQRYHTLKQRITNTTTPHTIDEIPDPTLSTKEKDPTTPSNDPTTPSNDPATPSNDPATPNPDPATPNPDPATPAPNPNPWPTP
jgi:low affinity Fe/Cu permease